LNNNGLNEHEIEVAIVFYKLIDFTKKLFFLGWDLILSMWN